MRQELENRLDFYRRQYFGDQFRAEKSEKSPDENSESIEDSLPDAGSGILSLPDGLGLLQNYVFDQMVYPDRAMAGVTALFYLTHYAQTRAIIASPLGSLALSECFIIMAKTSFGKEKLRTAMDNLKNCATKGRWSPSGILPGATIQYAIPASPQGLHKFLEENAAQTFMSDEFAEYLIQSTKNGGDTYKRATIGYLMEIYTRGFGTVCVPNAVTNKYKPVQNPRVTIFATTTGERLAESLSASQADSGTYNRFVAFVGAHKRIPKKYDGYVFDPSAELLDFMGWLLDLNDDTPVTLSSDAISHFREFDSEVVEPIKFNDPQLAGRLSEQALKTAGLIALGARRTEITKADLTLAYDIRLATYNRTYTYLTSEGSLDGKDATVAAFDQISSAIAKRQTIPLSRLSSYSRKYKALTVSEQKAVLDHLARAGIARVEHVQGGNILAKL